MKYFQITPARLQGLKTTWQKTLNNFRGPAPLGMSLAHMVAESNGNTNILPRDISRRAIGLMGVPKRIGLRFKYEETFLKIPVNNIYVWARTTNQNARYLHEMYPTTWTNPNYDFWLAVRLMFISDTLFNTLYISANKGRVTTIQNWVRTQMPKTQRCGTYNYNDIIELMNHIDRVREAMILIDGPDKPSYAFNDAPSLSPGATSY